MQEAKEGEETADAEVTGDPVFTPAFHACLSSWAERREAARLHAFPSPWAADGKVEMRTLAQQVEDMKGMISMTEEIEAVKPSLPEALTVIKQQLSDGTADPNDVAVLPLLLPFESLRADAALLSSLYECMHAAAQHGYSDPLCSYSLMLEGLAPRRPASSPRAPLFTALDDLLARHHHPNDPEAPPPSLLPYASLALGRLRTLAQGGRQEAVEGTREGRDHRAAALIDLALDYASRIEAVRGGARARDGVEAWAEERGAWEAVLQAAIHTALAPTPAPPALALQPILQALDDPAAKRLYLSCPYLHKCAMLRLTQAMAQAPPGPNLQALAGLSLCLNRTLLHLRQPPPTGGTDSKAPHPGDQPREQTDEVDKGPGLLPGVYYLFHPYGSATSALLRALLPVLEDQRERRREGPRATMRQVAGVVRGLGLEEGDGLVPLMLWQMAPHVLNVLYMALGGEGQEDKGPSPAAPDDVLLFLRLAYWVLDGLYTDEADQDTEEQEAEEMEVDSAPTPGPPCLLPLVPLLLPAPSATPTSSAPTSAGVEGALAMLQLQTPEPSNGLDRGGRSLVIAMLGGAADRQLLPWTRLVDVVLGQGGQHEEGEGGEESWWLSMVMYDMCRRTGGSVLSKGQGRATVLRHLAEQWDSHPMTLSVN